MFGGGLKEWDTAAPFAVAEHHGYVALDGTGAPFAYNRRNSIDVMTHPRWLAGVLVGNVWEAWNRRRP